MSNQQLPTTDQQRDQETIITKDLKWQNQTEKSCKTANRVLGFIALIFRYKNKELILPLYKSLVRPHLEHAVQFWSPHLRRDNDKMEKLHIHPSNITSMTQRQETLVRKNAWSPNTPGAQEAVGDIQQITPKPENDTQGLGEQMQNSNEVIQRCPQIYVSTTSK